MPSTLASPVLGRNLARARYLRKELSKPGPSSGMTWGKVWYILPLTAILDILRFIFVTLIFSGPALIGVGASALASGSAWTSWLPSWLVGGVAALVAGGTELIPGVAEAIESFGIFMAMVVGLFGFILIALLLLWLRVRLSGPNALRLFLAFIGSVTPIGDAIPSLTPITYSILKDQIKADKKKLSDHKKEQAELQNEMRQLQIDDQQTLALEAEASEQEQEKEQVEQEAADIEAEQPPETVVPQAPYERAPPTPLADVPSL